MSLTLPADRGATHADNLSPTQQDGLLGKLVELIQKRQNRSNVFIAEKTRCCEIIQNKDRDHQIILRSDNPVTKADGKLIVDLLDKQLHSTFSIHINSNVHGGSDGIFSTGGNNPVTFALEDLDTAQRAKNQVSTHQISKLAPPIYPPGANVVIDLWCYSNKFPHFWTVASWLNAAIFPLLFPETGNVNLVSHFEQIKKYCGVYENNQISASSSAASSSSTAKELQQLSQEIEELKMNKKQSELNFLQISAEKKQLEEKVKKLLKARNDVETEAAETEAGNENATSKPVDPKLLGGELLERYENYVCGKYNLTSEDRCELAKVTEIGHTFLYGCSSIATLDFSPLKNVAAVGHSFLNGCSSITTLDLTPLSNVSSIGDCFLSDCSSITTLDLTPLSNVSSIGDCFLSDCSSITTLDLTPLNNVTKIGNSFLHGCSSITTLDLTPLSNVKKIGNSFLSGCSSITTLDLTPLSNVKKIGNSFLSGCSSITTLDLAPLKNVTSVGNNFLGGCSSNVQAQGEQFKQRKGLK